MERSEIRGLAEREKKSRIALRSIRATGRDPSGNTPEMLSIRPRENIPLCRNSDLSYVSLIPAHP
jgi:hypothetical protein